MAFSRPFESRIEAPVVTRRLAGILAAFSVFMATPAVADDSDYLQCVPYARQASGIAIYGDAYTWWGKAKGHYARGSVPKKGAVMSIKPYGNSQLGHVAAVSKVVDSRTILISHANWSPIDGRRGQIERNVKAVDVSPDNDWSEVRIWYAPLQALGGTHWPLNGFIYPESPKSSQEPAQQELADPIGSIILASAR
ncbi:MAG: CHAP domain-containing protein [Novosphingobium sp.]